MAETQTPATEQTSTFQTGTSAAGTVTLSEFAIVSATDTIAATAAVTVTNDGAVAHNLAIRDTDHVVRVINELDNEDTTLHPHGVNGHALKYDGVASITQEPIAPGAGVYEYVFEA